jgi:hypothetical protein
VLIAKRLRRASVGNMRTSCGSRAHRSLSCIVLIDADLAQSAGKNITENITDAGRSRHSTTRYEKTPASLYANGIVCYHQFVIEAELTRCATPS